MENLLDLRIGKSGVPILSNEQIEQIAENFLKEHAKSVLTIPGETPLEEICTKLNQQRTPIRFVFDEDLGTSPRGRIILGKIKLKERVIYISPSLHPGSARWRWALAHELGHLVLHSSIDPRKLAESEELDPNLEILDSEDHFRLRLAHLRVRDRTPREWMEMHANNFAAMILLPKLTFVMEHLRSIEKRGIRTRTKGVLYLDRQLCNRSDFIAVRNDIALAFHVTGATVKYRMLDFGLLDDQYSRDHQNAAAAILDFLSDD